MNVKLNTNPAFKILLLSGAPGVGKTTISKRLDLGNTVLLNLDDYVNRLCKEYNITLDQKNCSSEDKIMFSKILQEADKEFNETLNNFTITNPKNIVLDKPFTSFTPTLEYKTMLEERGYKVGLLHVYSDLISTLRQNNSRFIKTNGEDRSIDPYYVLRAWISSMNDLFKMKELFKEDFTLTINNNLQHSNINIESIYNEYLKPHSVGSF